MNMLPSEFWLKKVKEKPWKTTQVRAVVVILAVLGIALILWPTTPNTAPSPSPAPREQSVLSESGPASTVLEKELSQILSQISGVGAVQAKLTLKSEGTKVYATNERIETRQTQEKDQSGTTRNITEQSSDRQLVLSNNTPVLEESKTPEIVGVLVIAEGAEDPAVEENLSQAVTGLLGLPASRVTVLPMEKGGIAQ
jgi:stage III sporulation protein AG